jgi:M-phase inducer tyrosine phosphatase
MEQGLGSYFFDPHSPEHAPAAPCSTARRPNLSLHLSSSPNSSPVKQQPRPAPRNALGSRVFEKTASSAVLPTFSQALGMSGAGPAKSSLGKRANPYARRPALAPIVSATMGDCDRALKSAYPVLGSSQASRLTAPAPRRSMSAADHSGVLGHDRRASNGSGGERMMMLAADMSSPDGERRFPPGFDASGSPIASSARPRARPALLRQTSKDDTSPLGYGSKRAAEDRGISLNEPSMAGSPSYGAECMPGFGASEREGKVLPCFTAKADGLMRISPATLVDVLEGRYQDEIKDYHVIDCRFGYEYDGGHVPGAINLSTIERVKAHILTAGQGLHANQPLPLRTQSGRCDGDGNRRKTVLIFHCEFSCKRAPSLALALRHADRALQQDYPSCHFPELYILEGGYCAFFKAFPTVCQPQRYVEMDDPTYCDQRSSEISGFRKQFAPKQPFNRHRSFTFGERVVSTEGIPLGAPGFGQAHTICEEESSFEDSPSAAQAHAARNKRPLLQPASKPAPFGSSQPASFGAANVGDTSFGSSVGDSSFEEGPSDSPCAVAARRPTAFNVGALADSLDTPRQTLSRGLGGRVMQRANTSANVLGR